MSIRRTILVVLVSVTILASATTRIITIDFGKVGVCAIERPSGFYSFRFTRID